MIGETIGAAPVGASESTAAVGPQNYTIALGDALTASEFVFAGNVYYALRDVLSLSDSFVAKVQPTLRTAALVVDAAFATTVRKAAAADAIALTVLLRQAYDAAIAEGITVDTVGMGAAQKLARLTERVLASGVATSYQQAYAAAVAAVAVIALSGANYFEGALTDAVATADTLVGVMLLLLSMDDAVTLADTASPAMRLTIALADSTAITSSALTQAVMTQLFADAVGVAMALSFGGEEFVGFMLNAPNKAASTYTNFAFNSLAKFDGRYYAMADDGLYELVGGTDDGAAITAAIRTGLMNFGSQTYKRLPAVYIGAKTDGTFVFKVTVTSDTGSKQQYWYTAATKSADAVREHRIEPGKGLQSVYWQFELETVDGADLMLDTLALVPMIMSRRS